jgi:hypothetical protein
LIDIKLPEDVTYMSRRAKIVIAARQTAFFQLTGGGAAT